MKQKHLLGAELQLEKLSRQGDPLEKVKEVIDFEMFREALEKRLRKESYAKGGRPAYDVILMFKILMLQSWYNISDDNAEYLINDRLSFMRFLGLEVGEKVPDSKTIWLFKEQLGKEGIGNLFIQFNELLELKGIITHKGSIVDAAFVDMPKQRNSRDENKTIKEGNIPEEWQSPENANKLKQKDTDARWTKKNNQTYYGYKNSVKVDKDSKIIKSFSVTSANVHDSQELLGLLDKKDEVLYGDSAYNSKKTVKEVKELAKEVKEKGSTIRLKLNEKGCKNKKLTDEQKIKNRLKSKVRARVEHVFGYMSRFMNGIFIRTIGIERAKRQVCAMNLAYNMKRVVFLNSAQKTMS